MTVELTAEAPVAECVARALPDWATAWPTLSYRARQRLTLRVKRRLNQDVVRRMTPALLQAAAVWEIKAQSLRKQNLLSLSRDGETFAQLGGLDALKNFCRQALQPGRSVQARGALLLSPPGCGKSQFCRALGTEVGRPVLSLDIGRLMGSLVGETERNIR